MSQQHQQQIEEDDHSTISADEFVQLNRTTQNGTNGNGNPLDLPSEGINNGDDLNQLQVKMAALGLPAKNSQIGDSKGQQQDGSEEANGMNADVEKEVTETSTTPTVDLHHHRKLPAELNHEIFYSFNLATRRKFICGLGWGFYGMFRQILLMKTKRLRNPLGNAWGRSNGQVTISEDGLNASKNTYGWQYIYAEKGFPVSGADSRMDHFAGTICYYFEVKILTSVSWCMVGLSDGKIPDGGRIGQTPNSYEICILLIPNCDFYQFYLAGQHYLFEFPEGVIGPELKETGNVVGCGILMNPDDKVTIFFTLNGILAGHQFPIDPTVDHLFPTTELWNKMSCEANFGDNPAKPFEYDIKKCPGLGLDCILAREKYLGKFIIIITNVTPQR